MLFAAVPLGGAGTHAVRAHLSRPSGFQEPAACGTELGVNAVDDQDDLVFEVSP